MAYKIKPFTLREEKTLVSENIPFRKKGNTAMITEEKDFVRAAFNLLLPYLPTEKDFVKGVL